ncbi:hypothetical protein D3C87_378610 [compost metagenome]
MKKITKTMLISILLASSSAMASDMSCVEMPSNASSKINTGGYDAEASMRQGYDKSDDPAATLFACASMAVDMNPTAIISDRCGCKQAVKEMCKFEWKKGKLKISAGAGAQAAWCVPFKFLAG